MDYLLFLINEEILRKRCLRSVDDEIEIAEGTTFAMFLAGKKEWKDRGPDEKRIKDWWTNGYQSWSDEAFKKHLRVKRETFNFIVNEVQDLLIKAKYFSSVFVHCLDFFLTLCLISSYAAAILTRLRRHRNQHHRSSTSLEGLIDVAQEATLEISCIICLLPFLYLQADNSSSVNSSDYASISTN